MTDVELRRVPSDDPARLMAALNFLIDRDLGNSGGQVTWYGFSGTRRNVLTGAATATDAYTHDVHSAHASGLLAVYRLPATARTAVPSVANCAALIQALGILIGAGKSLRLYASGGASFADLSSDTAGSLVLGGTTGDLTLAGNVKWKSGTGFVVELDHAATANRVITVPDATDTLALLARTQTFSGVNTFSNAAPIVLTALLARVTGPFGDATRANRPFFQSSAANGDTNVNAMPSGSNTIAKFEAYNSNTPGTATGIASLEANSSEIRLSAAFASGTGLPLRMYAGNLLALSIANTGAVTVSVAPLTLTAGQIEFPATQNPSANANTLDDYEEGTWTPTLGGTATYLLNDGKYTKVGNVVLWSCRLSITSLGTGSTSTISGLPFTAAAPNVANVTAWASVSTAYVHLHGVVGTGTTTIQMFGTATSTATLAAATPFASGTTVQLAGFYFV